MFVVFGWVFVDFFLLLFSPVHHFVPAKMLVQFIYFLFDFQSTQTQLTQGLWVADFHG